jgi:hypothetical protein
MTLMNLLTVSGYILKTDTEHLTRPRGESNRSRAS